MIYIIRHGESTSNAGQRTRNTSEVPLTAKGFEQSYIIAEQITKEPDLIVTSPFLRAKQTAEALIKKFPNSKVKVWNIQEFTFLDSQRCENTTVEERRKIREEYIKENNPDFIHGKGAESFNQLIERVDETINRILNFSKDKFVVIFTHGMFINTLLARIKNKPLSIETFFESEEISNCSIIKIEDGNIIEK